MVICLHSETLSMKNAHPDTHPVQPDAPSGKKQKLGLTQETGDFFPLLVLTLGSIYAQE